MKTKKFLYSWIDLMEGLLSPRDRRMPMCTSVYQPGCECPTGCRAHGRCSVNVVGRVTYMCLQRGGLLGSHNSISYTALGFDRILISAC